MDKVLKRLHYPLDVMLTCVRWYVAYPLSLRNLEEMMAERGVSVDHRLFQRRQKFDGPAMHGRKNRSASRRQRDVKTRESATSSSWSVRSTWSDERRCLVRL
jgi:transposase-like protein